MNITVLVKVFFFFWERVWGVASWKHTKLFASAKQWIWNAVRFLSVTVCSFCLLSNDIHCAIACTYCLSFTLLMSQDQLWDFGMEVSQMFPLPNQFPKSVFSPVACLMYLPNLLQLLLYYCKTIILVRF